MNTATDSKSQLAGRTTEMSSEKPNTSSTRTPDDVLLEILEREGPHVKPLIEAHGHTFHLAQPQIYSMNNYEVFGLAIVYGLIPTLRKCLDLGAVPDELIDPCPAVRKPMVKEFLHLAKRNYLWGHTSFENCFPSVMWLHEHQEELANFRGSDHSCSSCRGRLSMDYRRWIIRECYRSFEFTCSQRTANGYVDLIRGLLKRGATLVTSKKLIVYHDTPMVDGLYDGGLVLVHERRGGLRHYQNPLTVTLFRQAPVALLELTLQAYQREGIRIRSPLKHIELRGRRPDLLFGQPLRIRQYAAPIKTELHMHLRYIYSQLFVSRKWRDSKGAGPGTCGFIGWNEAYFGQMVIELEQKVEILVKYDVITKGEQEWLEAAVVRLQKMQNLGRPSGFNIHRNGKLCWDTLFPSEPFPFEVARRKKGHRRGHGKKPHRGKLYVNEGWDFRRTITPLY